MTRAQRLAVAGLLVLAVGVFSAVRIAKSSLRLWDFNIYAAAAEAWAAGRNPYDERELQARWNEQTGRMDLGAQRSIAPPTALVLIAPLAVLPLRAAFVLWALLSIASIVAAVLALWRICGWTWREPRALVLLAGVIASGPFILGVSVGQPSVPAVACIVLAASCLLREKQRSAGILLALAAALKIQLAAPVILYYLLRGRWRSTLWTFAICALIGTIALVRLQAGGVIWFDDWKSNVRSSATAGGRNDFVTENKTRDHLLNLQLPFYALSGNRANANLMAWMMALVCVMVYLIHVGVRGLERSDWEHLLHLGYVLIVSLLPAYHRYYDGIVLMVVLAWALRAMDEPRHRTFARLTLVLLTVYLLPVGWAMNLINRGYVPSSIGSSKWWNAVVISEQSWMLLVIAMVLSWALSRTSTRDAAVEPAAVAAEAPR